MYEKSSKYYDLMYAFNGKDYKNEAKEILSIIMNSNINAKSLLDVACGSGEHAKHFEEIFEVDGIDINENFISICNKKGLKGSYSIGNMSSFDLKKKYDVITCLFSAIGFLSGIEELNSTIKTFKRHLNENGLILIEPFFEPKDWIPEKNPLHLRVYEDKKIKYVRMSVTGRDNNFGTMHEHHLVAEDSHIEHFEEYAKQYLFEKSEIEEVLANNRFEVKYIKNEVFSRGLFIGSNIDNT